MTEAEALARWHSRLASEWLPNWVDMTESYFHWWNLLVIALEDATD